MALFEGKTPAERNKMIAAIVFGGVALLLLLRLFFGGSGTTGTTNANRRQTARNTSANQNAAADEAERIDTPPREVRVMTAAYTGGEPGRNIFAFYVPPPTPVGTPVVAETPLPTPTPPSLILASVSPQSVYAQTGEFKLQVSGDKFTSAVRVYVDGQEVPTQFGGAQQLTATVPAFLISAPGARTVMARTPDNLLFSNTATVNVMQPPVPSYTYIGYLGRQRYTNETAVLKDQKNELVSVQLNDIVGGRFRVTNITAQKVELTDKDLKIKHTINYTDARASGPAGPTGPGPRGAIQPPPRTDDDDEEP
jgi:hypothetical protein